MAPRKWSVEEIVNEKIENGSKLYEVLWTDWPTTTWEPAANIVTKVLIEDFEKKKRANRIGADNGHPKTPTRSAVRGGDIAPKTREKRGSKTRTAANPSANGNSASIAGKRQSKKGSSNGSTPAAVDADGKTKQNVVKGLVKSSKVDFDCYKRLNHYETERLGFEKNLTPDKIIGALDKEGELLYLLTWNGSEQKDFVLARDANEKCPQLVIEFLQSKIKWNCMATV